MMGFLTNVFCHDKTLNHILPKYYPWKNTLVRKPIIANNVTRNLANLFPRKSKQPYYCKQCGKNFSYLLFLEKRCAKFLVTLQWWVFTNMFFQVHERTHTEENPFACSKYDKTFKKVLIWMSMKGPTQERNYLLVPNVKKLLTKVVIWRCMKGPTLDRSLLPVPSVIRLFK